MKRRPPLAVTVFLVIVLTTFYLNCRGKQQESLIPELYTDWSRLTDVELDYFIPGHESHYRIPYINEKGKEVTVSTNSSGRVTYDYPEGTIIVKEIYPTLTLREDDKPVMLTVMIKNDDHPQAQEGWVWVVKDVASGGETIFKTDMCSNCHDGANGAHPYGDGNPEEEFRDYVYFPWTKETE